MDQLVASLRALAISRKTPSTLEDILSDYAEFEGCAIDVKKYGFRTIEDLLDASGEFNLSKKEGETFLIPKPKTVTAHITKMVKRQKSVKQTSSCKIYSNVHIAGTKVRRKAKKRPAEKIIKYSKNSSSESSSVSINVPPAPSFQPAALNFSGHALQHNSLPASTLGNFHKSFPEPITNYNDVEVAVALEVWTVFSGVPPPIYNVYLSPHYNGFCCTVFVDNFFCSTDPACYESPLQAKIEAGYIAMQIINNSHQLRLYPVFHGAPHRLMQKMFEGLKNYVGGVPCHLIPRMFRETYGETLPKNWLQLVKMSKLFSMRTSMSGDVMILPNWR